MIEVILGFFTAGVIALVFSWRLTLKDVFGIAFFGAVCYSLGALILSLFGGK